MSATLGGPVNALAVAAQAQLEVAQVVGPRLDRDIQAYLHLVRDLRIPFGVTTDLLIGPEYG